MSKLPKMFIYSDTFLADTQDLSDSEFGCYCRLLMFNWGKNCEGLPTDVKRLQRITHSSEETIKTILKEQFYLEKDKYQNKKQLSEFNKAVDFQDKLSESGKLGAMKRWGGYSDPINPPNSELMPTNTITNTNTNTKTKNIYSQKFEDFWKEFVLDKNDNRSTKLDSFKGWKKLSDEEQSTLGRKFLIYKQQKGNFFKALERFISKKIYLEISLEKNNVIEFDENEYKKQNHLDMFKKGVVLPSWSSQYIEELKQLAEG